MIKKQVHRLDVKIMRRSQCVIHVDNNRVMFKECNWIVIENTPVDIFDGKQRNYNDVEPLFAVIGHMSKQRGLIPILNFAQKNPDIRFLVVGRFINEEDCQNFKAQPNVEYYDYMLQNELFKKMRRCCAIFSLYDPSVEINRLAASNKVYDAMMFGIPVITNKEVINSGFIKEKDLGFVIDYNLNESWACLTDKDFMLEVKKKGTKGRDLYLKEYQFSGLVNERLMPILNEL